MNDVSVTFDRLTDVATDAPTLIEGFPGFGLVAAIAVEQITTQLGLEHHGNIVSDGFPQILSYRDGHAQDVTRVYAGRDIDVMTLQSDLAPPPGSFESLSRCVREDLASEFERAIFLAGAPARSEDEVGNVEAITTTPALDAELRECDIELAEGAGLVGGVTGALASDCYHTGIPAAVLVVRADPYFPDPGAAQAVIENALEPLVDFDIDTSELEEQSDQIRQQMEQVAERYRQMMEGSPQGPQSETAQLSMYQ